MSKPGVYLVRTPVLSSPGRSLAHALTVEVELGLAPVLERRPLATGDNRDRLVAELYVTDAARGDGDPQPLGPGRRPGEERGGAIKNGSELGRGIAKSF